MQGKTGPHAPSQTGAEREAPKTSPALCWPTPRGPSGATPLPSLCSAGSSLAHPHSLLCLGTVGVVHHHPTSEASLHGLDGDQLQLRREQQGGQAGRPREQTAFPLLPSRSQYSPRMNFTWENRTSLSDYSQFCVPKSQRQGQARSSRCIYSPQGHAQHAIPPKSYFLAHSGNKLLPPPGRQTHWWYESGTTHHLCSRVCSWHLLIPLAEQRPVLLSPHLPTYAYLLMEINNLSHLLT